MTIGNRYMVVRKPGVLGLAAFMIAALVLALATSVASADPTFGVMNASGGIYWRSAPDWNTAEAVAGNGFYPNTIISVHCYQTGVGNVPGSTDSMWEQASDVGGSGTGSGWINEHFINDGSAINQPSPGVPPCTAPPPPLPPTPTPLPAGEFAVMNASGGIYWRSAPDWNTPETVSGNGFYPDTIVSVYCYQSGAGNVPGSADSMWEQASIASGSGTGNGWINEHFVNDGAAINQPSPGIPPCSPPAAPSTPNTPTTSGGPPSGAGGSSSGSPGAGGSGCPTYGVVDSRGSGEPSGTVSPPGTAVIAELMTRHPGTRVGTYWNPYAAVGLTDSVREWLNALGAGFGIGFLGAYHGSVVDGTNWLRQFIPREIAACPHIHLTLVGYSQGAQVTGDVYQRDVTGAQRGHINAVLLFGDPYFNAKDTGADRGNYDRHRSGTLGTRHTFRGDRRVISYCHYHDPVCQSPSAAQFVSWGFKAHENYPPDARRAASLL
jgi:hypothetical protein